jgi:hypothetical protein
VWLRAREKRPAKEPEENEMETTTRSRHVRRLPMWGREKLTALHRTGDQRAVMLRPCKAGHDTCGCIPLGEICCLTCPLPECLLVLNERAPRRQSTPRREKRGTRAEERATAVAALLGTHAPAEIQKQLGLNRAQYRRAIVYMQKHSNDEKGEQP